MFILDISGYTDTSPVIKCKYCNKVEGKEKFIYSDLVDCRETLAKYMKYYSTRLIKPEAKITVNTLPYEITRLTINNKLNKLNILTEESLDLGIDISNKFLTFFTSLSGRISRKDRQIIFPPDLMENLILMSLLLLFIKNSALFLSNKELPTDPISFINYISEITKNYASNILILEKNNLLPFYEVLQWKCFGTEPMVYLLYKSLSNNLLADEYITKMNIYLRLENKCICGDRGYTGIREFIDYIRFNIDKFPPVNFESLNSVARKYFSGDNRVY